MRRADVTSLGSCAITRRTQLASATPWDRPQRTGEERLQPRVVPLDEIERTAVVGGLISEYHVEAA